ncbi:SidA/IucD/PvdA family monooxygenase [Duganella sp. FT80W]|uniref:SidA/IucD/PvdA family monooxygenase n=1 Tax=Duganella guangzhouensis TaxID=2666084 RepID=A0A6I2KWC6_9BURK|nr:NAD(P)-binding domain-containing protein [Duganella guangzhouensis]MRW90061.1 SidA/IucD/PvdA family monooxygenase [Duganella guangzhouensis]
MSNEIYDYIIVGAGPAGLQLGYFLKRAGRKFIILESGPSAGTFFKQYPRHRKLISANKVHTGYDDSVRNMRWDWNSLISDDESLLFKHFSREFFPSADVMVDYLQAYAERLDLPVRYDARVEQISRNEHFSVRTADGETVAAHRLVMATGVSQPYIPDIPGVEHAEVYTDVSVEPEDFAGQRVLIVGKGNSAFETADNIIGTASRIYVCSPTPITLAWKSKFVGHLRAVNNNFVDTYQLKLQNVMLDAELVGVKKKQNGKLETTFHYVHADDEVEVMEFDRVILCTGFRFDASLFDASCRPELAIKNRFPAQTSAFESRNVKDLYFAGTIMQERDFKKKQSGFVHGFRHNVEGLFNILESRYFGTPLPAEMLAAHPSKLAAAILARANRSPGIWQQTGFLCDVIVRSADGESYLYHENLPTQYVHDSHLSKNKEYYVVTLEFGIDIIYASPDPLAVERIHKDDVERAHLSTGIHPIIRRYSHGQLQAEHHVVEDIIPEWDEEAVHVKPLEQFLASTELAKAA